MNEKTVSEIIHFSHPPIIPERKKVDAERVISGKPLAGAANYFADQTGAFMTGIWESTKGSWKVSYDEIEFCHILAGKVSLTDSAGNVRNFKAGDSFVIPAGFNGSWETHEDCRKLYCTFKA